MIGMTQPMENPCLFWKVNRRPGGEPPERSYSAAPTFWGELSYFPGSLMAPIPLTATGAWVPVDMETRPGISWRAQTHTSAVTGDAELGGDFLQPKGCAGRKGSFEGCQERRDKLKVPRHFWRTQLLTWCPSLFIQRHHSLGQLPALLLWCWDTQLPQFYTRGSTLPSAMSWPHRSAEDSFSFPLPMQRDGGSTTDSASIQHRATCRRQHVRQAAPSCPQPPGLSTTLIMAEGILVPWRNELGVFSGIMLR